MPKKKRKTTDIPDSQTQDRRDEESEGQPNVKLKRSFVGEFIVISDSDGEQESKEEPGLQKKRKQQLDGAKLSAKRKFLQMTEDEQFALALKMSEQEARQLNSQEEEEEELLKKAIAASLSSFQSCDASPVAAVSPLTQAPGPLGQSHPTGQEHLSTLQSCSTASPSSKCSSILPIDKADDNGQTDVTKRPLVLLTRLSQDIVESSLVSSIIVSPGKNQPSGGSNEKLSTPGGSDSSDTELDLEEEKPIPLSPTFPQKPLRTWSLAPRRLFVRGCSPSKAKSKETEKRFPTKCLEVDPLAGCSDPAQEVPGKHNTLAYVSSSPSTELEQPTKHSKVACLPVEPMERTEMQDAALPLCPRQVAEECKQEEDRDTVHYYWGVPFCPKGVDPNKYTQVILCQLEVYQKSLKQAQRQLLQKKRFGNPVVPNSNSLCQSKNGQGKEAFKGSEGTEEHEGEDMDDKKEPESVAWLRSPANRNPDKNPDQNMAEGQHSECRDEPASSSSQASQVLFAEDALEEGEPMQITQSISALTPLDSKRNPDIATENRAEEEITICPETQPSPSQAIEPESREIHSSSKDVSLQANSDENVEEENLSAHSPPADDPMSCPMCDRRFPVSEIELHAMYCNGTEDDSIQDSPVMTRRQREAKNKATCGKETPESVETDKYEKCYVCKSLVPLTVYQRHVEGCLWSQDAHGHHGDRRLHRATVLEKGRSDGGRLLSMLEQSEHKAADAKAGAAPSGGGDSRHSSQEADKNIEHSQDVWNSFPQAACSDSPIKSFTPISEAKDCLVDFKKQLTIGSGSRRQTKNSFRSRKKF